MRTPHPTRLRPPRQASPATPPEEGNYPARQRPSTVIPAKAGIHSNQFKINGIRVKLIQLFNNNYFVAIAFKDNISMLVSIKKLDVFLINSLYYLFVGVAS